MPCCGRLQTTAGEYTFIGHPKDRQAGKVLMLALAAEVGFEVDADECSLDRSKEPASGKRGPAARCPDYRSTPEASRC